MGEQIIRDLLNYYALTGENFDDTPNRVIRTFDSLIHQEFPKLTTFPLKEKPGIILIKDYVTWSFCPHHLLPVKYTFKIGYIPDKRVLGLSKLPRLADWAMRFLPLQEDIPAIILNPLEATLKPKGAGVIVKGEHLCMQMRGVKSECVSAVSSGMRGAFLDEGPAREEFLLL